MESGSVFPDFASLHPGYLAIFSPTGEATKWNPRSASPDFAPLLPGDLATTLPTNLTTWPKSPAAWAELKMPCLHANLAMDLTDRLPGCLINEL